MTPHTFGIYEAGVLIGISLGHVLRALILANNGNMDVTFKIRNWRVTAQFDARLVGDQGQERMPEPTEPPPS